jgi:ABC-type antimicrobial peptide transport system permease subunit
VPLLSYALKRIVRSWKLFVALILGMVLAATFFGGINVGADTIGKQALDQQLQSTPFDQRLQPSLGFSVTANSSTFQRLSQAVRPVKGVLDTELLGIAGSQFNFSLPQIYAISDNSALYNHMAIFGAIPSLPNQTLAASSGTLPTGYKIGEKLSYELNSNRNSRYNVTFTVVGLALLDSVATNTLGVNPFNTGSLANVLIVSWENTYAKIVDWAYQRVQAFRTPVYGISGYVDVYLDRGGLIAPSDISGSVSRVTQVEAQVTNVATLYGFDSSDYILGPLSSLAPIILELTISFTIFAIPVFFMAWYVGRTVSQASYNLRRKEIGLLMTKGFSKGQLLRHFLVEALLVGVIAGVIGLGLAVALNPFFVQTLGGASGTVYLSTETGIITVVFTVVLTLLSIYSPAREASSMDPAKALREYVYVENVNPRRQRGALLAFSLGLYKIILLTLGINFATLTRYAFAGGFLLAIVIIIMSVLDFVLTFIGPFLFLYGATQLSTGLAVRFHNLFTVISKRFVGDVASLASKSVFRNPRRVVSLVFLVAIIAGYSLWVVGDLASTEDFNLRQAEVRVGSDISLHNVGSNATFIANQLRTWGNVSGTTSELDSSFSLAAVPGSVTLRAIDPLTWRQGAYYEDGWFSSDLNGLMQILQSNSNSVILDRGLASYLNIQQGAKLILSTSPTPVSLQVIGFFGPDYSLNNQSPIFPGGFQSFGVMGWSYIPQSIVIQYPSLFRTTNSTLVKASPNVSLSDLSNSVQHAYPRAMVQTAQVATQGVSGIISNGMLNVLRLGTVFAAAAACIGVGAVSYTGFKEREKETTMIAVRGLSYRRLIGLLIAEVLPLVIFALILATIVGLITVRGDALASSSQTFFTDYYLLLAPRRVVFPLWAQETIALVIGLLFLGVFIPALLAARKDLSKMSRTVRFA